MTYTYIENVLFLLQHIVPTLDNCNIFLVKKIHFIFTDTKKLKQKCS